MKKLFSLLTLLLCANAAQSNYANNTVIINQIHPHEFKWLLTVNKECSDIAQLQQVRANLSYYIQLTKDHIKKLEKKIKDGKTMFSSKRLTLGIAISSFGLFLAWRFKKIHDIFAHSKYRDKNDASFENMAKVLSIGSFSIFSKLAWDQLLLAWQYKARIHERIERDKKILTSLEKAQKQIIKSS